MGSREIRFHLHDLPRHDPAAVHCDVIDRRRVRHEEAVRLLQIGFYDVTIRWWCDVTKQS